MDHIREHLATTKNYKTRKAAECDLYSLRQSETAELAFESTQILDLPDEDFSGDVINMFKELKEAIFIGVEIGLLMSTRNQ